MFEPGRPVKSMLPFGGLPRLSGARKRPLDELSGASIICKSSSLGSMTMFGL